MCTARASPHGLPPDACTLWDVPSPKRRAPSYSNPQCLMQLWHLISTVSGMYRCAIWACHEEGSSGGTIFWDFLELTSCTYLIPWPEVRTATAERSSGRQAWRDAIKSLAPLEEAATRWTYNGLALAVAGECVLDGGSD
eukprot:366009-Chlamydomonas_euryale.AAC.26